MSPADRQAIREAFEAEARARFGLERLSDPDFAAQVNSAVDALVRLEAEADALDPPYTPPWVPPARGR